MIAAPSDPVMSAVSGHRDAQRLMFTVRQGCAPADALFEAVELVRNTGDAERLRGFLREVQKTMEHRS